MRAFLSRLLLLAPLVLLGLAELLLPPDAFTFRAWEALFVSSRLANLPLIGALVPATALPGPFLPGSRHDGVDVGDLGHHTPLQVPVPVVWQVDRWGYRADDGGPPPDLVIIGDSMAAGSGLTQADTLASVLGRGHGLPTYPLAPRTFQEYLDDLRLSARRPRLLVIESVERSLLESFGSTGVRLTAPRLPRAVEDPRLRALEVALLKLVRMNSLAFLRAHGSAAARSPSSTAGCSSCRGARRWNPSQRPRSKRWWRPSPPRRSARGRWACGRR